MGTIVLIVILWGGNTLMNKLSGINYRTHINPDELREHPPEEQITVAKK